MKKKQNNVGNTENKQEKMADDSMTNEGMDEKEGIETETEAIAVEEHQSDQVMQLQQQLEELNQRFLRVAADFDNFKRRTAIEKTELMQYSNAKILGEMLPIMDNFQLALNNSSTTPEVENVIKGVDMIYRQLAQVLEQAGMVKIEALGKPFDPNKHEAIMQVQDDSVDEDTIIEELRCGYMLKDRVIRPSMVKVSTK